MERFSHASPWPRILMEDPATGLLFFSYDCDPDLSRVVVSDKMEVSVRNFGDHVNIVPIKFDNHDQFEKYALACIVKAHEVSGKTFTSFQDAGAYISNTCECGPVYCVLGSAEDRDLHFYDSVESALGTGVWIFNFTDIKKGEAYVLPSSEYLGVISEDVTDPDNELHGIAIINTRIVTKVEFV